MTLFLFYTMHRGLTILVSEESIQVAKKCNGNVRDVSSDEEFGIRNTERESLASGTAPTKY
jgi:hypothetical protein